VVPTAHQFYPISFLCIVYSKPVPIYLLEWKRGKFVDLEQDLAIISTFGLLSRPKRKRAGGEPASCSIGQVAVDKQGCQEGKRSLLLQLIL